MNTLTAIDSRQQIIDSVLNALDSEHSKRAYKRHLNDFINWHTEQGKPGLTKYVINEYKSHLQSMNKSASSINQSLAAIRKLIREAADNGMIDYVLAQGIANIKGIKSETILKGRHISQGEISAMTNVCIDGTKSGARDAAIIALLYSCLLRRSEVVNLDLANYNDGELKILQAKRNKDRTIYVDNGAKAAIEDWLIIRGDESGPLFYRINKSDNLIAERLSTQAIYVILQKRIKQAQVNSLSPHDFRRTAIGDLLDAGADIATVQKMAGHADVNTTARYDRRPEEAKKKAAKLLHFPYIRQA